MSSAVDTDLASAEHDEALDVLEEAADRHDRDGRNDAKDRGDPQQFDEREAAFAPRASARPVTAAALVDRYGGRPTDQPRPER